MQREITFKVNVGEDERNYRVSIPKGGQLVQIENLKAVFSANNYNGIMSSNTIGSNHALDMVDMNAYISVLVPELIQDLKVKDLLDLDIFDLQAVQSAYSEIMVPWINDWQTALRKLNEKDKD